MPDGSDNISVYPADSAQSLGVLDAAVLYKSGTISARSSVSPLVAGLAYFATDTKQWSLYDGTSWRPVGGMTFVTATGSMTASVGQYCVMPANSTLTLPAPTANAEVGVQTAPTVYGGAPVTVTTPSGAINGAGLGASGSTSFLLGGGSISARLISDGTNWNIVSGQQDSGWVPLTLGSGVSNDSGTNSYTSAAVRVEGDSCRLRGMLNAASGTANWATLPAVARPATIQTTSVNISGMADTLVIQPGGGIVTGGPSSAGTAFLPLDGIIYCLV